MFQKKDTPVRAELQIAASRGAPKSRSGRSKRGPYKQHRKAT
jgi:hypothetical protein